MEAALTDDIAQVVAAACAEARELRNPLRLEMEVAAGRLTTHHLRHLCPLGFSTQTIARLTQDGCLGMVTVALDGRRWFPEEGGNSLLVTPLVEEGVVVDLVAFNPKVPARWAARTGVGWALGTDCLPSIDQAWDDSERGLLLHATPADWLRSDRAGVAVVHWNDEARRTLLRMRRLEVDDRKYAQTVRLELTRPPPIPEIKVPRERSRAA